MSTLSLHPDKDENMQLVMMYCGSSSYKVQMFPILLLKIIFLIVAKEHVSTVFNFNYNQRLYLTQRLETKPHYIPTLTNAQDLPVSLY